MTSTDPAYVRDVLPDFAAELRSALAQQGQTALSSQVAELRLVSRCRCGDSACSTFFTAEGQTDPSGPGQESVLLEAMDGRVVVGVVNGRIVRVQVLYRQEVQERLQAVMP